MKDKTYYTARLEIRPAEFSDYDFWVLACELSPFKKSKFDDEAPIKRSRKYFQTMINRHKSIAREDKCYVWWFFDRFTGELIGYSDIFILTRANLQKANLGYHIFNYYWRKGYAREALTMLTKKALLDLKLNCLEAVIDLDNLPSRSLVRKLGFRKEGLRKNYLYENKKWLDQMIYSKTRFDCRLPMLKP